MTQTLAAVQPTAPLSCFPTLHSGLIALVAVRFMIIFLCPGDGHTALGLGSDQLASEQCMHKPREARSSSTGESLGLDLCRVYDHGGRQLGWRGGSCTLLLRCVTLGLNAGAER
jgi:hypothetical protein